MPAASIEEMTAATAGQTAPGRFLDLVRAHPNAPALRARRGATAGAWEMWTYSAYADRVAEAAAGLQAVGLGPGERVMLLMRNRPDFHWLDAAAQFVRVTPVSIYNSSSADEVQFLLEHAEARVAIVEDAGFLDRLLQVRDRLPLLEHIFVLDPPPGIGSPERWPVGVAPASELFAHGRLDLDDLADEVDPTDIATLIYTSGTTGPPKGVMISQGNVVYTAEQLRRCIDLETSLGRRVISYLPMAHIAERMTSHYQAMILGFDVYCCPDPALLAPYMREVHPEIHFGVPRVWEKFRSGVYAALAATPDRLALFEQGITEALAVKAAERAGTATEHQRALWRQIDELAFGQVRAMLGMDALQVAVSGAAPISRIVLEWFEAIGVPISEIYGLSESSGPMTWDPHRNKPGYVGRAIPGCEVRIAADGEVCCRGGNVFQGYFKQPEATATTLVDGWLHSGDIGELDHEGYLRIVDRKKEIIITSGGKNISPANLEAALTTVALVGNACAIGDNRKYITALIALDADAARAWGAQHGRAGASLAQLAADPDLIGEVARGVAQVNRQFAQVERIKTFTIVGEEWVPGTDLLTPTSKLKRRGVLARYGAEIDAMYDEPAATVAPATPATVATVATVADPAAPAPTAPAEPEAGIAPIVIGEPMAAAAVETVTDATAEEVDGDGDGNPDGDLDDDLAWEQDLRRPSLLRRWWWLILLAIVVVVAVLGWVIVSQVSDDTVGTTSETTAAPVTTPAPSTIAETLPPPEPTLAPTTAASTTSTSAGPSSVPARNTLLHAIDIHDDLVTLRAAIDAAAMEAEFEADGPTTIFAPTDEAFQKLPTDQLDALLADKALLVKVLRHHMVDGIYNVEDLFDGPLLARDGTPIEVVAVEDLTLDETARLVETDIATLNGVLHTIDTVLVPPDVDLDAIGTTTTTSPATTVAPTTSGAPVPGPGAEFVVFFDPGSGVLNDSGRAAVEEAAAALELLPKGTIVTVTGVTDTLGGAGANDYLAGLRANTVIGALKQAGATNVKYVLTRKHEPPGPDPQASRRADIDYS